jgi:hypothetical protein
MAMPSAATRLLAETMHSAALMHVCTELAVLLALKEGPRFAQINLALKEGLTSYFATLDPRALLPNEPNLEVDFGAEIGRRLAREVVDRVSENVRRRLSGPIPRVRRTTLQTPPRRNPPKA